MVAHLRLVPSQKALAGIAGIDAPFAARTADEVEQRAETGIGQAERSVAFGASRREDREEPPMAHPLGDEPGRGRLRAAGTSGSVTQVTTSKANSGSRTICRTASIARRNSPDCAGCGCVPARIRRGSPKSSATRHESDRAAVPASAPGRWSPSPTGSRGGRSPNRSVPDRRARAPRRPRG